MANLNEHHAAWIGRTLTDVSDRRIGKIDDIYTDDDTGQPEWLAVTTGLTGPNTCFVPLRGATASGRGVQVPFPKNKVKLAWSSRGDGTLSRRDKGRLYAHYGYVFTEEQNTLQRSLGFDPPGPTSPADGRDAGPAVALLELSGPADGRGRAEVAEASPTADRSGEGEPQPPADRGQGRGQWPDDEAIFLLSQPTPTSRLAATGTCRRR